MVWFDIKTLCWFLCPLILCFLNIGYIHRDCQCASSMWCLNLVLSFLWSWIFKTLIVLQESVSIIDIRTLWLLLFPLIFFSFDINQICRFYLVLIPDSDEEDPVPKKKGEKRKKKPVILLEDSGKIRKCWYDKWWWSGAVAVFVVNPLFPSGHHNYNCICFQRFVVVF